MCRVATSIVRWTYTASCRYATVNATLRDGFSRHTGMCIHIIMTYYNTESFTNKHQYMNVLRPHGIQAYNTQKQQLTLKHLTNTHTHTHTHNYFTAIFPRIPGWASARRRNFFWTLWCKGKYQRQTHRQSGWAPPPSGLISNQPRSSPHFYAWCPFWRNSPNLSWLGTGTKYADFHNQWLG